MGENPKYPPNKLSEEDKEILDKAVLNYAVKCYALTEQYSSPKKYAEEVVLKTLGKDRDISAILTLAYTKNSPEDKQITPGELNQKLANDIQNIFQDQYKDLRCDLEDSEFKKFLNPRELREGVLQKLEEQGIFIHLTTKDEILRRQEEQVHLNKRSSKGIYNERGGKPSAYILSDEIKRLKKAMEKPDGIEHLYKKVISSGLAEKLLKFQILSFLYAVKMDKRVLDVAKGAGTIFFQDSQCDVDSTRWFYLLQKLDDNTIEQLVDSQIKSIIEDRGYYTMLFFAGLFKL